MTEFGIPIYLVNLVRMTLLGVMSKVKIGEDTSRAFTASRGLRQDDALYCVLFNLAMEKVIKDSEIATTGNILNKSASISIRWRFSDIVGRSERDAVEAFLALERFAKEMGLCNIEKTKYMYVTNRKPMQNRKRYFEVGQHRIEAVDDFMYLGSLMDRDNDMSKEIKRRIVLANRCYFGLAAQPKSRNISCGTKIRIYKMILRPVLTSARKREP